MPAHPRTTSHAPPTADQSRLLPFLLAGLICLIIAVILGYGGWRIFINRSVIRQGEEASTGVNRAKAGEATTPTPAPPLLVPIVPVPGGEVVLGGGDTGLPLRREVLAPFEIAETEVTNEQYRNFIAATGHRPPANWKEGTFPPRNRAGTGDGRDVAGCG
jgi:formylglycine-generating enzyme required for sulfatase activity